MHRLIWHSVFPAFVLLVSKVVLIFDPLGGKPQAVLIFGAVLSLGPVLIFGAGVYITPAFFGVPNKKSRIRSQNLRYGVTMMLPVSQTVVL